MLRTFSAATLLVVSTIGSALAHTPLCSCYDNGDGTVLCEGGFSDGSSAAGVKMSVLDGSGKAVIEGALNKGAEFSFKKPGDKFTVFFDAGEGHQIKIPASEIH
ncbi:MAG: hypothetical protein JXQ84_05280 [Rhodospirillaceae bacterium]|nr:hypothetical protein [Rhodospirillaceae bacterium]